VEGLQKGSAKQTTAAKDNQSNEEQKNLFCITTPSSKRTQEVVADLTMLGSAECFKVTNECWKMLFENYGKS
jgi:hypothetical protein